MQANDAAEQPNRIQVVVRVRPVLPHELTDEVAVTCSTDARKLQVLLPDRLAGGANLLPGATRSGARSYEFDACLPGNTTQEELYETCGLQELVEAALDGYCVTVFAFGQTGSGKTHTIIGPRLSRGAAAAAAAAGAPSAATTGRLGATAGDDLLALPGSATSARSAASGVSAGGSGSGSGSGGAAAAGSGNSITVDPEDGILTRCIAAAYRSIEARSGTAEFAVTASVVELYNEAVTDLLALDKTKQLQVRKDSRDGFAVTGLTQVSCPTDVAAVRYMVRALQYRHTRGHRLNEYSSRSHCLMTFVFASKETGPGEQMGAKGGIRRYGKLALVDLAGSERLKDTGNTEKGAVRETGAINKSLFTLGQVLAALSARSCGNANANSFVPFRDSKLTQLLWDGLRGSGRCLMLACLGPMRTAAEESLNTLHFATMATRIKAEPVVLLDPQDQLVLNLRKTITQLREENRQLAGALQQLSLGADASAVLAALPEGLRAHAGSGGSTNSAGSGAASPSPPDQPGTPSTPQRQQQQQQQQVQPVGGSSGKGRQPFETAVAEAVAAVNGVVGNSGGGGGECMSPPPPQQQQQQVPLLQSSTAGPLRASYGSSSGYGTSGGVLLYQQSQQPPSYQSYPQPQQRGAVGPPPPPPAEIPSPSYSAPVNSRVRGKQNSRIPQPMYGMSDGAGRNGRKQGAVAGKGGSPRAKSVGRGGGGGRPTYLTEDPAALLFGYSNALQPPPPLPPPGSGSSSTMSLPILVPTRGAPGVAPPPPALSEFPELAAMEAEFQNILANGGGAAAAAPQPMKRVPPGSGPSVAAGSGGNANGATAAATAPAVEADADDAGGPRPDVRALKWAERNAWFGTDYDMTAYAYQVHDRLVDVEHVDPTSDLYYIEIERHVAEKFPDRWTRAMKDQLPGGSGAAAVAAVRRAAPSPMRTRPSDPPLSSLQPSYGAALRVNIKDPLISSKSGGTYVSSVSGSGTSRDIAASLAAQAAAVRARQQQQQPQVSAVYADPLLYESFSGMSQPETPLYGAAAGESEPSTPPLLGVNPFNIGALHSVAPPKAARLTHLPGASHGMVLVPVGAEPLGAGRGSTAMEISADPNAAERIQREYARQRALVVEELRKAKEEAEAERQRILARIQRAAGGNKWR
ncbi:hypothetical protein Vafri_21146 [Volvox africanus]|uniref:Kinesin motor domain-containing protein n=3 Tax=Volvox africanus TaxID=51714 RepID=A0A8J4BYE3_9CHLO|nr:hypothetical protein Vafri_21146 [Volvox africanus]